MARRKKQAKIAEFKILPKTFEFPDHLRGKWAQEVFHNDNPIVLELGCGKGEYTLGLAERFPGKNIIGVDIKGVRLWSGAKAAQERELPNAAFARFRIEEITRFFAPGEVSEIWIPFPDPYPKPCKDQKRLVSERFRSLYAQILKPQGLIHFKTDNDGLFQWAIEDLQTAPEVEVLDYTDNLYDSPLADDLASIQTTFEAMFREQGIPIKLIHFRMREADSQ